MGRCLKIKQRTSSLGGVVPAFGAPKENFSINNTLTLFSLIGLVSLLLIGCQSSKPTSYTLPPAQAPSALTVGDVVKTTYPAAPELNQSQKIGTEGTLSLPMIGQVHAAGKTPAALQSELQSLYKSLLQNNEVVVTVESRAIPVVVSGAVQKPGKIVFERPATVLEAIMEAGGFTPEADMKKVTVIRIVKGQHKTQVFDLRPVLKGNATTATYVSGGDVIYVPERLLLF
jgi:protein involved in polysaccharide export with SLBB domain